MKYLKTFKENWDDDAVNMGLIDVETILKEIEEIEDFEESIEKYKEFYKKYSGVVDDKQFNDSLKKWSEKFKNQIERSK